MLRHLVAPLADDTPEALRRLALVLYLAVTPVFTGSMVVLLHGFAPAAAAVLGLCVAGALRLVVRRELRPWDWVFPAGIVPVLCCGIAAGSLGEEGHAFFGVMAAPLAWAAMLFELPAVVAAWFTAVVCMFVLQLRATGAVDAAAATAVFGVIQGLVGAVAYAKSSGRRAARLRSLERHLHDVELTLTADGTILDANDRAAAVYGHPREQLLGMNVGALRPATDVDQLQEQLRLAQRPEGVVFEAEHLRADGTRFPVEVSSRTFAVGSTRYVHSLIRDISARRRAEARDRFLAALVGQMSEPVVTTDTNLRVTTWSGGAERTFGWTQAEVAGRDLRDFFFVPDETAAEHRARLDRAKLDAARAVVHRYCKDGRVLSIALSVSALRDDHGDLTGYLGVMRDVTAELEAEEALRRAKEAAEVASQAREQFLANVSHELRTPLTGVLGTAELLLETTLDPAQARMVRTLQRSGESLLTLLNDVLDFARIDAGRLTLTPTDFSPREVVDGVVELFRPQASRRGVTLAYTVAREVPAHVRGDAGRFRQVLSNLVGNAVKFTEAGRIDVVATCDGEHFDVAVHDTGIGLRDEELPRLFQPFSQADATTARRFGGTGLGLVISRSLAEAMGGTITVESRFGEGSTFTARFHFEPVEAVVPVAAPPPTPLRAGVRVLYADDTALNRELGRAMLERLGATVIVAENGLEAVELLAAEPVDLVLMDCQMPVMDGYEATRRIRAAERDGAHLPIVALTASTLARDRARSVEAGMDDLLPKPFKLAALRETLARWAA